MLNKKLDLSSVPFRGIQGLRLTRDLTARAYLGSENTQKGTTFDVYDS